MKTNIAILTLLLSASLCAADQSAQQAPPPADAKRVERVPVVIRVRLISGGGGSKYLWPEVELVAVIKNESRHTFPKRFKVAHYSGAPGIPSGVSTLYLQRYNSVDESLWRLLEGSGASGVSHNYEAMSEKLKAKSARDGSADKDETKK
jgi:hypothetical protein